MAPTTQITLVGGDTLQVEGEAHVVERSILDAARGSIMQFAWLVEAGTGEPIAVNPDHVLVLRALDA